jgi:hypothetical protein
MASCAVEQQRGCTVKMHVPILVLRIRMGVINDDDDKDTTTNLEATSSS